MSFLSALKDDTLLAELEARLLFFYIVGRAVGVCDTLFLYFGMFFVLGVSLLTAYTLTVWPDR